MLVYLLPFIRRHFTPNDHFVIVGAAREETLILWVRPAHLPHGALVPKEKK